MRLQSSVVGFFCLGLEVTQDGIGARCVGISNTGEACGKFEGGCEAP